MWKILRPPKHKPPVAAEKIDKEYKRLRLQVFIGIFIGYAGYYLVRKNFTLAMPHLVEMGFDKGDLGIALSANAIAYGLSKFLMGGVSDRSNARVFLQLGLVLSALVTMFLGTSAGISSIIMMFITQFLIGWFQGMGWPPCGRVMTHWFSQNERGTKMSVWNVAHNVGGGMIGPMAAYGLLWFGSWQIGTFWFPAVVAIVVAMLAFLLIRDTPQSTGLPPIEKYRNDYPKNYSEKSEQELTTKEIFFKYVLNNKILWYIAFANAFVYLVRYGVLDWAPTYLKDIKGYDIKDVGWAYSAYEWAAIPGTIICGWLSDKVFKGRRAITTMIYMALVAVFVVIYWKNGQRTAGQHIADRHRIPDLRPRDADRRTGPRPRTQESRRDSRRTDRILRILLRHGHPRQHRHGFDRTAPGLGLGIHHAARGVRTGLPLHQLHIPGRTIFG